jgi:hypothetical protein
MKKGAMSQFLCKAIIPVLLFGISLSAQKPVPSHFDLKGERLGESLEAFKKAHPDAQCSTHAPERQAELGQDVCVVYRSISFAGLPALNDAECERIEPRLGDGHNCFEGLYASFRDGKLISLSYNVEAEGGKEWAIFKVLSALTDKYGKPEHLANEAPWMWLNETEILLVYPHEMSIGKGKGNVSYVIIDLEYKEDYSKKDI